MAASQRRRVLGMQLVGDQRVLRPHQAQREQRTARVDRERAARVLAAHGIEIGLQTAARRPAAAARRRARQGGRCRLPPFAGLARLPPSPAR